MGEQVERYDMGIDCEDAWMQRYTDGDYVLYTDYAALQAENEALREQNDSLNAQMQNRDAEIAALKVRHATLNTAIDRCLNTSLSGEI